MYDDHEAIGSEFGTVAMAAYRPDPELFGRQLRSIRDQTHSNFECLISADGDPDVLTGLVRDLVDGDGRFRVIGFTERKGFYGNFERAIAAASPKSTWIALADQDDFWYSDKLARLLPHLATYSLVSGQARVVEHPSLRVLNDDTRRLDVSPESFVLTNQFTGSLCVFRRELLELALPFPRMSTPSEVHDHWIALCASARAGTIVTDDIVQDYVQHGANVVGEMLSDDAPIVPSASWATVRRIADRYEGAHGPRPVARAIFKVSVGWRQLLVETLAQRVDRTDELAHLLDLYGRRRRLGRTMRFIRDAEHRGLVANRSVLEYLAGWAAGWFVRGRSLAMPPAEHDDTMTRIRS